ncbi:MAG: tetratricopeptide repeat protein, partial [Candidatus Saccharicenans sp.]
MDYWNLGEVSRAENAFIFALAYIGENRDESIRAYANKALEIIKLYRGAKLKKTNKEYHDSERLFKLAIEIAKSSGINDLLLKCIRQLCLVYWQEKRLEEFLNFNEIALNIATNLNNAHEIIRSLNHIGAYYFQKKDLLKGYDYFDRALVIAERENLINKEPIILFNLGATSYYLAGYELSAYYFKRAFEIYKNEDDLPTSIAILYGLGLSLYRINGKNDLNHKNEEPIALLNAALELSRQAGFKDLEARILNNIGYIYLNDELAKAEEFCLQAWKMGVNLKDQEVIASSLNNLATIRLLNSQVKEAINYFQSSQRAAIKADYWAEIWKNYNGLGKCYEKLGDYRRALFNYQKALESFSQIRESIAFDLYRVGFDREKREVYEGIIRSLIALRNNNPNSQFDEIIFSSLNRIKGKVFIEELDRLHETDDQAGINEELSQLDQMISLLLSQPENLGDQNSLGRLLELEYRYLRLLGQDRGHDKKNNGQSESKFNLDFIQKQILKESRAFLDYFIGQQESYCFFITQNDYQIIKLPREKEIEKIVKLYIKLLSEPAIAGEDLRRASYR